MTVRRADIQADDLVSEIGILTPEEIDRLPFGAILLDPTGTIRAYNAAEEQISGRKREDVIGRNFFTDVAPCTRVRRFFGSFQAGVEQGALNEVFDFTFHFPSGKRDVRIRMMFVRVPVTAVWIFVTPMA